MPAEVNKSQFPKVFFNVFGDFHENQDFTTDSAVHQTCFLSSGMTIDRYPCTKSTWVKWFVTSLSERGMRGGGAGGVNGDQDRLNIQCHTYCMRKHFNIFWSVTLPPTTSPPLPSIMINSTRTFPVLVIRTFGAMIRSVIIRTDRNYVTREGRIRSYCGHQILLLVEITKICFFSKTLKNWSQLLASISYITISQS